VPTITPIAGIPFVPPGQVGDPLPVQSDAFSMTGSYGDGFTFTDTTISTLVTNTTDAPRYATFAIYRAPGGGSGPSENLRSQVLIYSETVLLGPKGSTDPNLPDHVTFSKDIRQLDQTGPGVKGDHLTGDDDFQCEVFDARCDSNGYAPDKLNDGTSLDHRIVGGNLFNWSDSDQNDGNGKKKK